MSNSSRQHLHSLSVKRACENCGVRRLCLPVSLDQESLDTLSRLVQHRGPFKTGSTIYLQGAAFRSLYAIQHGAVKTYGITEDGTSQITGFHLAGELVGMDAIVSGTHPCHAVALENTWVCELPYTELEALSLKTPKLHHELMQAMSREILGEEHALMAVCRLNANQRILYFLDDIYRRMQKRFGKIEEFRLPMSREDMANYLGLTPETVSRSLKRLREDGILHIEQRRIRFLDHGAVQEELSSTC